MEIDWKNPWLWILAIVLAVLAVYFVGPLTAVRFPLDLFFKGGGFEIYISGWIEYLIFIIVIRLVLGAAAAKWVLEHTV